MFSMVFWVPSPRICKWPFCLTLGRGHHGCQGNDISRHNLPGRPYGCTGITLRYSKQWSNDSREVLWDSTIDLDPIFTPQPPLPNVWLSVWSNSGWLVYLSNTKVVFWSSVPVALRQRGQSTFFLMFTVLHPCGGPWQWVCPSRSLDAVLGTLEAVWKNHHEEMWEAYVTASLTTRISPKCPFYCLPHFSIVSSSNSVLFCPNWVSALSVPSPPNFGKSIASNFRFQNLWVIS